jgi:GAF domain-containing protein/HAMP domain-containing protein
MDRTQENLSFTKRLVKKWGGFYILIVLGFSQITSSVVGLGIAILTIQTNAGFSSFQLTRITIFAGIVLLLRDAALLIGAYLTNPHAIRRLNKWSRNELADVGDPDESHAWKQIVLLPWRYIIAAFISLIVFSVLPILGYLNYFLNGTVDQVLYTLIGGVAAGLVIELIEVLITERLLSTAREILLPKGFETQISGVTGSRLLVRFLVIVLALILVSVLFVVPIGYHQTVTVLYEEIGSTKVLSDLQLQSLIASIVTLIFGLGLSFLLARSISNPVRQLISVFQKIEKGDLKQRVNITATDEVGELAVYFNRMITRLDELQSSLEKSVADRTKQLKSTLEVGSIASSILDTDELITRVVNLITDRFGYYYAAIFTVDASNHWAELKDATGEAGATLKARGHRLELAGSSMVGTTITTRQPRIAQNVGLETVRFNNPLLPDTRSEIALPLIIGSRVIGALDVQSIQEAAFGEEEIDTLQGMANQVAIALENARLFQETRANLEELRATHRLYVTEAWSETARTHGGYEFNASPDSNELLTSPISVPLTLRDQIIGQLQLDGQQEWTPEEQNLIEAVATQASLALENARLLEESQQLALRERLTTEITGKIWSSPNMEAILQTAIKELGRALRADEGQIELNLD